MAHCTNHLFTSSEQLTSAPGLGARFDDPHITTPVQCVLHVVRFERLQQGLTVTDHGPRHLGEVGVLTETGGRRVGR